MITTHEPTWLKEYRKKNLNILEDKPLKKSQYFDVKKLDLFLNVSGTKPEIKIPKEIESHNIRVINWKQALNDFPDQIKFILEKEEIPKTQYEAFVNAYFNSGFVIIIKRDSMFENLISYKLENTQNSIIKNIIIIQENVENLKILEHLDKEIHYLNETILLQKNAKVTFCRIFNVENTSTINLQTLIEKDALLKAGNAFLNGNFVTARIINSLIGQGSSLEQLDFSYLNSKQFYNVDLRTIHKATDVYSYSELKTVLKDNSKNLFDGMIKITPDGQKANALLKAHSLLLSREASSNNIPGLEIEADDVKATHSATSTNIDEDQLFYLESRGINKEEARHTMIKGFLESIIFKLPEDYSEILSEVLNNKIESTK
ncbi:SufD family Fe-S cluster assembly protein [Candidatus Woesearchaeota archaeon]|nr:SufD family Fe-S cluster assembly protein [Candidatus Woesearchaeota archaeon]